MGHQVENRHRIGRSAQCHRHVTELRQRGISHHALDVILDDAQKTHEQRSDGANHHDETQCGVTEFKQRRHARDHEDTGCDHGGRVDQGRDRGRAFHRVRQPDMQRELGGLAHGANEQTDADHGDQHPIGAGKAERSNFT